MTAHAGERSTRQRAAIASLLDTLDDFRSAQELHDELRRRGENIGLTTVYRTLQSMSAAGMLDTLRTDTGESVYRRCSEHHHHHLVCRSCGSTVEVGDHEVEAWAAEVATKHGFSDVSHTIEIYGTCSDCGEAVKRRPWSRSATRDMCRAIVHTHMGDCCPQLTSSDPRECRDSSCSARFREHEFHRRTAAPRWCVRRSSIEN